MRPWENGQTILIDRITTQLKESKSKDDSTQKEETRNIVAGFLADQIRDASYLRIRMLVPI
jgi:hypothetical protein